jgi:hypothetical protein
MAELGKKLHPTNHGCFPYQESALSLVHCVMCVRVSENLDLYKVS